MDLLGGVKINHKTQVLTQEAKVIPGLYCAGTDACNIFETVIHLFFQEIQWDSV